MRWRWRPTIVMFLVAVLLVLAESCDGGIFDKDQWFAVTQQALQSLPG